MTDNEIIKAIHCCMSVNKYGGNCDEGCPYIESQSESGCYSEMLEDALDLINRQKVEIERLKAKQEKCFYCTEQANKKIGEIKAEAIKEFWSRLQGIAYRSEVVWSHGEHPMLIELDDAEEIYEEMVGEG